MSERGGRGGRGELRETRAPRGWAAWGTTVWAAGILALLVAAPLSVRGAYGDRLATHWGASGEPDGSLPPWAAAVAPAAVWAVLVVAAVCWRAARRWRAGVLASGGVLLAGAQVSIARANLHHADWRDADPVSVGAVVTLFAAAVAGCVAWRVSRRPAAASASRGRGARMEIPEGSAGCGSRAPPTPG